MEENQAARLKPWGSVRHRLAVLFIGNLLVIGILLARAAYLADSGVTHPANYSAVQSLPGLRGSLLSANGELLAWSERQLRLVWHIPLDLTAAKLSWRRGADMDALRDLLPDPETLPQLLGKTSVLLDDLSRYPAALDALVALGDPQYQAEGLILRRHSIPPDAQSRLGTTQISPTGVEIGVDGLEKKYDKTLRAQVAPVAVSRNGASIMQLRNTFFTHELDGRDVRLPESDWPVVFTPEGVAK